MMSDSWATVIDAETGNVFPVDVNYCVNYRFFGHSAKWKPIILFLS